MTHEKHASCASSSPSSFDSRDACELRIIIIILDSRKVRELRTFFRRVLGHPGPWPNLGYGPFPARSMGVRMCLRMRVLLYPVPDLPSTRVLPIPWLAAPYLHGDFGDFGVSDAATVT